MVINTSNLLTQVNAGIAAVTSSTSEADLIALSVMANKLGADRTVLDAEIQTRITNLTGAEATKTNLTLAVAGIAGGGGLSKFLEYTSSDTFVVPNGIFTLRVLVQGGGGNGGAGENANGGGGGGGGGSTVMGMLHVAPSETLTITVGAAAGDSLIEKGSIASVIAAGGGSGTTTISGGSAPEVPVVTLISGWVVRPFQGGQGSASGAGQNGSLADGFGVNSSPVNRGTFNNQAPATGGATNGGRGGGGGGSSSYFGKGGNGGAAGYDNNVDGVSGGNALVFGAGGGGGGEGYSTNGAGGTGGAGVIQIWY
jgi:hypothetical protein